MTRQNFEFDAFSSSLGNLKLEEPFSSSSSAQDDAAAGGLQVNCFTEIFDDVKLHFQIIRLHKQVFFLHHYYGLRNFFFFFKFSGWLWMWMWICSWVSCTSAKFGHLFAAAPTRPVSYSLIFWLPFFFFFFFFCYLFTRRSF
ncbi:hypothetical protein P3X46_027975 [Hevea brasiliensis]|uniref:Uncharacterized protein n=1 Tax=Hevea brasiliensis TaxID=3981 RepID=A0ABQ9L517_HEVBR|nr:hypothetical protein P3X46_027975 [Hevea brasiliensis]